MLRTCIHVQNILHVSIQECSAFLKLLVLSHRFQQSDWSVYVAVSDYSTSYLMCVGSDGHTKGSSQSKVCQFDHTLCTDEQVLRLQVSMQDAMRMTELNGIENLVDIAL